MTRDARSLESIAPRHHGCTRVADAPITASLRGCASRPVTSPGILFLSISQWRRPCWDVLHGPSSPGVDREDVLSFGFFSSVHRYLQS